MDNHDLLNEKTNNQLTHLTFITAFLFMDKKLRYIRRFDRYLYRRRLRNRNFTLIANNCIGGVIMHDMHLQFRTPTVNLCFDNSGFLTFCEHLEYYCSLPIMKVDDLTRSYPVGKLSGEYGDVHLFFMHYSSFEEAEAKWRERVKRMDYSNLFVIMESQTNCDEGLLERFDRLPYKKVVLTDGLHPNIEYSFPIRKEFYAKNYWHGKLLEYPTHGIRRYYDVFDYVAFFNKGIIRRRYV